MTTKPLFQQLEKLVRVPADDIVPAPKELGSVVIEESESFVLACEGWYDPIIRIKPHHVPEGANAYTAVNGTKTSKHLTQYESQDYHRFVVTFYQLEQR